MARCAGETGGNAQHVEMRFFGDLECREEQRVVPGAGQRMGEADFALVTHQDVGGAARRLHGAMQILPGGEAGGRDARHFAQEERTDFGGADRGGGGGIVDTVRIDE